MVSELYPILDLICILILAFLGLQNERFSNIGLKQRYLRFLITEVTVFCCIDAAWGFFATHIIAPASVLFILTTLYFLFLGLIATSWVRFVVYYVDGNAYFLKNKFLFFLYYLPFIAEVLLLLINVKTGFLFFITPAGEYYRNPKHYVLILFDIQFLYYLTAAGYSIFQNFRKKKINQNIRTSVHFFSLIPLLFIFAQLFFPYMPFYATGLMLSVFDLFIFDVIDERELENNRTLLMQQRQVFEKCEQILSQSNSTQRNIEALMALILSYYNADRIFILEYKEDDKTFLQCKYEFCKPGVQMRMKDSDNLFASIFEPYIPFVKGKDCFYFNDISVFGLKNSDLITLLKEHDVTSGLVAPIRFTGTGVGFIGIDNPHVQDENFSLFRVILVFIYSELLRRRQLEAEQKTSGAVLLALAAEYSSVYFVDVKTGNLRPYRYNSQIKRLYGEFYKGTITYKAAYEMWLHDLIAEQDREAMKPYGDIEYICKKLKYRKNVKKQFLCTLNGKEEYFQTKWVKVDSDDEYPSAFVLGVANIDEQVRSKELLLEQKKELEKQQVELDSAKVKAEDAQRISQTDQLTDLYNKVSGQMLIGDYIALKPEDEKYALIFIDIDKFKDFNDKFGHLVGDEILMEVGKTIKAKCRQNDIPIRFGGDEFVILLKKQYDEIPALHKAEEIQKELETLSIGKEWSLTCSIGIYLTNTNSFDEAVEKADEALYDVKGSGRNDVKLIQ